ncbi:hypothetical protein [Actinomyces succiniciruminis]|uniref:hypothetical protein n=1 Tax=Actinomyces succiniciruminis TaxID=1522002 RepID=UPI001B32491E|nr:hypothetical protein [Actinomyces succiniciruminis]
MSLSVGPLSPRWTAVDAGYSGPTARERSNQGRRKTHPPSTTDNQAPNTAETALDA